MAVKSIKTTNLFIYGTLKRGCRNYSRCMLSNIEGMQSHYVGPHEISGHKIVILTQDVPGIVFTGEKHHVVVGEIHAVQPDLLARLAMFERGYDLKQVPDNKGILYFIVPVRKGDKEHYYGLKEIPLDNEGKFNYTPALNEKLLEDIWGKKYAFDARQRWNAHLTPRRDVA